MDAGRQKILDVTLSALNRRYTTPLRLDVTPNTVVHGGNNVKNTGIDIARSQMKFGTTQGMRSVGNETTPDCVDIIDPNEKKYIPLKVRANPDVEYLDTYGKFWPSMDF